MFSKFTESARKVLLDAKKEMLDLKHPYVGSEHLLLAILKDKNNQVTKILNDEHVDYRKFKDEVIRCIGRGKESSECFLYTPLLKKIIEDSIEEARNQNIDVNVELLFMSLLHEGEGIAIRIMIAMGVNFDSLIQKFPNHAIGKKIKNKKKLIVDEFGYDMNKKAANKEFDPVIGREEEVKRIIEILCRRTKNNPLLIGEAGVGKSAIVEELSRKIVLGEVPDKLKNKRIVSVAMSTLVSGTKYRGEFEERITKMLKELEQDNNVIVFIDEIHTLVGAGGAEGAIDASNILKPILARGKIKVIGATTIDEYKKYIENDRALERRFQAIKIEEPNVEKTKEILCKIKPIYEEYHEVNIPMDIIDEIVSLSNKYIYDRKQPDKAIDLLDEVCSMVSVSREQKKDVISDLKAQLNEIMESKNGYIISQNYSEASKLRKKQISIETEINRIELKCNSKRMVTNVTRKDLAKVIKSKTQIPVFELMDDSNKNIIQIQDNLRKSVLGQDDAVEKVYEISKRIRFGLNDDNKPLSLLFVGPTGVGKTYLAKEFCCQLIGNNKLITLDMSEYKEEHSISKIIGAPPGYAGFSEKNTVLEQVRNNPYSVILVDELEKAHPSVINLFLQILDEGRIKDSAGNVIRFDHNIIIMTSNLGFDKKQIGFNSDDNNQLFDKLKNFYSAEVINRIDDVIIFNRMSRDTVEKIVLNKLKIIKTKYKDKGIKLSFDKSVIDEIINESQYEEFGARRLERIIKSKIDNIIIDNLIQGNKKMKIETINSK